MACRARPAEDTSLTYYVEALPHTCVVQELSGRASVAEQVREPQNAVEFAGSLSSTNPTLEHNANCIHNNYNYIHLHQGAVLSSPLCHSEDINRVGVSSSSSSPAAEANELDGGARFEANDPTFHLALLAEGVDFGYKVVSKRYKARKSVLKQHRMIIYSQCESVARTVSHAATLHLSRKRSKHVIFLLDCSELVDQLDSKWVETIHFTDIATMIQGLGAAYEYHRQKVKKSDCSIYLYLIKPHGRRLSERGRQDWINLLQNSINSSPHSAGSSGSNSQFMNITQLLILGLNIGAII
ncbi:hypothetical protein KP509_39G009200 [Ceratopteris richardii]|uniref:DUF7851 domain-containing protein n=1 Tax=Ceratopteris richardii TaxID=49495 RepID=A0A8T2PXX5_CERRI|nr:hypothetical protein KP509_39G009200 [Ceratopteris richardii]